MVDREKVIKGLECCTKGDEVQFCRDEGCPYADVPDDCMGDVMRDALELLKAQEPVTPIIVYNRYVCAKCRYEVRRGADNYCPCCGKRVKWDG